MGPSLGNNAKNATGLEAARHLCQEARVVLTSLRGGPPAVARGELAQDLMDLRVVVKAHLQSKSTPQFTSTRLKNTPFDSNDHPSAPGMIDEEGPDGAVIVQRPKESSIPTSTEMDPQVGTSESHLTMGFATHEERDGHRMFGDAELEFVPDNVGLYARPILSVVMDPRAAGPHTLVALRALFRLLECGSLVNPSATSHIFIARWEPLMRGVLACKFEQTDAGADEAVEMAIADLLALLVKLDQGSLLPSTLMDAFNTVFVTRNTFVHSPALCYHFEDVLSSMVTSVFQNLGVESSGDLIAARRILEFLVNQLLHTPLTGGDSLDEPGREAQLAHDATRVLCLRLTRCCLEVGWNKEVTSQGSPMPQRSDDHELLRIIQDDLCLSLLMTGQAIWAYAPGFISVEVLSEICATMSALWNTVALRDHLVSQFETMFTGFYQRALVLLRKRLIPLDSVLFNENLVFDAEVEVILESLVDLFSLQEESQDPGMSGSLIETLFSVYDCDMCRSDVVQHLIVELCRCCGAHIDDEGGAVLDPTNAAPPDVRVNDPLQPAATQQPHTLRPVPPHLKELCAEALLSGMKCLFREDDLGEDALESRARRRSSFLPGSSISKIPAPPELEISSFESPKQLRPSNELGTLSHRTIKSRKRLMRKAAKLFNQKATKGIDFMVKSGLLVEPVTPKNVASFLRNGLVLGLDKAAVGQYLGELGKAPVAGKSPPSWERDWFHKDALEAYCSLFRFEGQSLLDGLRMFLAAFRLPGEGQQIDRIVQAFADSCGRKCDEAVRLNIFSDDPKRAGDAAFLLAYSIIMLNTDQHNPRIREDKKMSLDAFLLNNTDYGRDITEKGKEFPREFLKGIYESIREEEIRTEREGAEGHMTVERWKDVLRGSSDLDPSMSSKPGRCDRDDLKELIVESMWTPVLSAVSVFWGVSRSNDRGSETDANAVQEGSQSGMLSAQGARLGMDLALEMLGGIRNLGRLDIFRRIFWWVCQFSGLLGTYSTDAVDRTSAFVNSVEAQSAVVAAIQTARDAGDEIGEQGWKQVWGLIFELRDLKLLGGGRTNKRRTILTESDQDLLLPQMRREWNMRLVKGDQPHGDDNRNMAASRSSSFFGAFGRAFFGSDMTADAGERESENDNTGSFNDITTPHGKDELTIWNDLATSDDEDDDIPEDESEDEVMLNAAMKEHAAFSRFLSAGANFESQLVHEDMLIHHQFETPITGLERVDETRSFHISPRARVRKRLLRACDFSGLLSESRFMDIVGIKALLAALIDVIDNAGNSREEDATEPEASKGFEPHDSIFLLSPASEALGEVLVCEVAIKNKDRLWALWQSPLQDHYARRLTKYVAERANKEQQSQIPLNPGVEKCATGLLRVCACAALREDLACGILSSLELLFGSETRTEVQTLDKHIGEGLWRICRNVDGLRQLQAEGWNGLLGLAEWCASRGGKAESPRESMTGRSAGLPDGDPALQAYRSIHLLLHAPELRNVIPFTITKAIQALVKTGERGNCPKLCFAGLDMLHELHSRLGEFLVNDADHSPEMENQPRFSSNDDWLTSWVVVLEGMADVAEHSADPAIRQHALSILTDAFLDKHGSSLPPETVCATLPKICIPLAGKRIRILLLDESRMISAMEEIMIEFEQCVSLVFKPLLHHVKNIVESGADLMAVWVPLLSVLEEILHAENAGVGKGGKELTPTKLRATLMELASEHLRNSIMVLHSNGVLQSSPDPADQLSILTWESVARMSFCKDRVAEWKNATLATVEST